MFSGLIRDDPPHPRHQRSINPYTDVKTALVSIVWRAETTLYLIAAIEQILRGMKGSLGQGVHGGKEYQEYQLCEIGVTDRQDFYYSAISLNAF